MKSDLTTEIREMADRRMKDSHSLSHHLTDPSFVFSFYTLPQTVFSRPPNQLASWAPQGIFSCSASGILYWVKHNPSTCSKASL